MSRCNSLIDLYSLIAGNSVVEGFFASIKKESVHRKIYPARDEARARLFDYIEGFYTTRRWHSTLG